MTFDRDEVANWCDRWLGSRPTTTLFNSTKISDVLGVRLADGREVVVKARDPAPRIAGCFLVQRHLWRRGFACPEPLAGPAPLAHRIATAERYVPGGTPLARSVPNARRYGAELAHAIGLAPRMDEVPSLEPRPYWLDWDHSLEGIWPPDPDVDLNGRAGPSWVDDAGRRSRRRIHAARGLPDVIGHGDWESQNLGWSGDQLLVAHDWDSAVSLPEALIAGAAALMFPSTGTTNEPATLDESSAFLDSYQATRGRSFDDAEREAAWAASLWIGAWKAKKATFYVDDGIVLRDLEPQVAERLRRAGA